MGFVNVYHNYFCRSKYNTEVTAYCLSVFVQVRRIRALNVALLSIINCQSYYDIITQIITDSCTTQGYDRYVMCIVAQCHNALHDFADDDTLE